MVKAIREDPEGRVVRAADGFLCFRTQRSIAEDKTIGKRDLKKVHQDPTGKLVRTEDGFLALKIVRDGQSIIPFDQVISQGTAPVKLDSLNIKQLKILAEKKGVTIKGDLKKAEIIAVIEGADETDDLGKTPEELEAEAEAEAQAEADAAKAADEEAKAANQG